MPQVLIAKALAYVFAGTAFAAGGFAVGGFSLAAAIQFVAITAASMAASKLLAPKMPSFADSSLAERSQMVRSPIASRQIIYGRSKVSGVVVYLSTTGSKNEYLHIVVAMAGHEVEEIGDVYFGEDLALTGSGSSANQGRFTGKAEIYKQLGGSAQVAQPQLVAATAGLTDGKWTSAHRLRGIAYIYVQLTWDAEVFANGIPNISAIVKGKKVYDPRTTTTVWSANPALCLRDYITSDLGMAMTSAEIDDTAVTAAANICEEQVQVLPLSPTAYENRYECNGVLSTSETPDANIGKLLSAMGGLIAYSGGKIVPYAAGYRIPTVTLNEKHFAGGISVQTRTSARDRVNAVKGVHVSEKNNWQVSDFPSIAPSAYYTADNSVRYWRDVALPFTTSSSCAQRLSVIELRRAREEITFSARFRLEAMQVRAGDTVMITNAKFGWTAKVFEVMEWHFATDGNPPQLAVEMTLRETDSAVYDWVVGDEVAVTTAPNTTLPDPYTLSAPTNLTLVADGTTQFIQADGTVIPRIKVAWSAPAEQFVQSGGKTVIEYKEGSSTTYLTWATVDGDQTLDFISSDVRIGTSYNVRLYAQSFFNTSSTYTAVVSITPAKATASSANPTGFLGYSPTSKNIAPSTNGGTPPLFYHGMTLEWTASTSSDVSFIEIGYDFIGSSTTVAPSAWRYKIPVGETSATIYGVGLNGYIWVRTTNRSGVLSTAVYTGINFLTYGQVPVVLGTIAPQSSADVTTTGIKTGAGSSTRQVNVVYEVNEVVTLTGGGTTENVNISLTNRGFSTKPDDGLVVVEDVLYQGFYNSQDTGSTSTNAVIKIYRNDGGALGSGPLRLSARFTDYT